MTGRYVGMSLAANSAMVGGGGGGGGLYLCDSDDEWTKINSVFFYLLRTKFVHVLCNKEVTLFSLFFSFFLLIFVHCIKQWKLFYSFSDYTHTHTHNHLIHLSLFHLSNEQILQHKNQTHQQENTTAHTKEHIKSHHICFYTCIYTYIGVEYLIFNVQATKIMLVTE